MSKEYGMHKKYDIKEQHALFVSDISPNINEEDLRSHFLQCGGEVEHVHLVRKRKKDSNSFAVVEFETRADYDNALQATSHCIKGCNVVVREYSHIKMDDEDPTFTGEKDVVTNDLVCKECNLTFQSVEDLNKHLESNRHTRSLRQNMNIKNSVFICGLAWTVAKDDLENYFSQFGQVKCVIIDRKKYMKGFVEFVNSSDCDKVLQPQNHYIKNRKVFVKRCQYAHGQGNELVEKVPLNDILMQLESCHSASHAINQFGSKLSLQESEMAERYKICADVESVLRKFYPACQIHIYGSTLNGYGITGCDLDILFEPSANYVNVNAINAGKKTPEEDLNMLMHKLQQHQMVVEDHPPNIHLLLVHRIMRPFNDLFSFICFIPARQPIVRFVHKKTALQCDLSCNNRLVLYNTQLLKTFGLLDSRVPPLMALLRLLAKKKGLIRVNGISSYAFSLMVIFFLQNTCPPVLPNVLYLRSLEACPRQEAGWDCTFCTDPRGIPQSQNQDSVDNLLVQFFAFYVGFDFALVICPLTGQATYRHMFKNFDVLDYRNFQTSPLCVQDPLELSRNVTAMVNVKVLISLKEWIMSSLSKLQNTSVGVSDILDLFKDSEPIIPKSKLIVESVYEVDIEDSEEKFEGQQMFVFSFSTELQEKMKCTPGDVLGKICCIVLRSLEYGLLFETQFIDRIDILPVPEKSKSYVNSAQSVSRKRKRGSSDSDSMPADTNMHEVGSDDPFPGSWKFTAIKNENWSSRDPTKPELVLAVQCVTHANTWHRRKSYAESNRPDKSKAQAGCSTYKCKAVGESLEQEHEVSVLMSNDSKNALVDPFCFECRCYIYQKDKHENLRFVMTQGKKSSKELNSFCVFLKSFLLSVLKKNLK